MLNLKARLPAAATPAAGVVRGWTFADAEPADAGTLDLIARRDSAEIDVLTAVLADPVRQYPAAAGACAADHFADPVHRIVWQSVGALIDDGRLLAANTFLARAENVRLIVRLVQVVMERDGLWWEARRYPGSAERLAELAYPTDGIRPPHVESAAARLADLASRVDEVGRLFAQIRLLVTMGETPKPLAALPAGKPTIAVLRNRGGHQ